MSKPMRFVGKGVYHFGPGGIEKPGDFGYRIDIKREMVDGLMREGPGEIQLAMHCPKYGVCMIPIHTAEPVHPVWQWDGNWESPTIRPSIGCDNAPRCGAHRTITAGCIEGEQ